MTLGDFSGMKMKMEIYDEMMTMKISGWDRVLLLVE